MDRIILALADLDVATKPSELDLPGYRLHPSGVTGEDLGAFRFRATGGSPSDSKMVTCMTSI